MTELGRSRKPSRARVTIARPGAVVERKHGEREHRIAVAARRSEFVPFGGAPIVLRHAKPFGIELAEKRHRLGIGIIRNAVGRKRKSGDEITALKRAIRHVRRRPDRCRRRRLFARCSVAVGPGRRWVRCAALREGRLLQRYA